MAIEYVEVVHDGVITTTEKAILLAIDCEEIWIPRSVIFAGDDIEPLEDFSADASGRIEVAEWYATREGLT